MISRTELTVFFDGSFWRALVERRAEGLLSIASHVFGEEPSDAEVFRWWISSSAFLEFTQPISSDNGSSDRPQGRTKKVQQAAQALRRAPISEEIRCAAQAERSRKRVSAKAARKLQRLAFMEAKREKRIVKAREKKRGR